MAQYEMALEAMRAYRPALAVPTDLRSFWDSTLADARRNELGATFTPVDSGLTLVTTYDVTFAGFGGSPVRGWLHLPTGSQRPRPGIVQYVGYGGGRGLAHEQVLWAAAGYAQLVMDTRGQGSTWSVGDTPDPDPVGAPNHPGHTTRGILDPATYYYRRGYVDTAPALEALPAHPRPDPGRTPLA